VCEVGAHRSFLGQAWFIFPDHPAAHFRPIKGKVLPAMGLQLQTSAGCSSLHADFSLQTDEKMFNMCQAFGQSACKRASLLRVPFHPTPGSSAEMGRYGWLHHGAWISRLEGGPKDLRQIPRCDPLLSGELIPSYR